MAKHTPSYLTKHIGSADLADGRAVLEDQHAKGLALIADFCAQADISESHELRERLSEMAENRDPDRRLIGVLALHGFISGMREAFRQAQKTGGTDAV